MLAAALARRVIRLPIYDCRLKENLKSHIRLAGERNQTGLLAAFLG